MFIHIKCNVSIKFNNGSSIVSITATCYKKHVIREDGILVQKVEYFAFGFLSICNIVVYGILYI